MKWCSDPLCPLLWLQCTNSTRTLSFNTAVTPAQSNSLSKPHMRPVQTLRRLVQEYRSHAVCHITRIKSSSTLSHHECNRPRVHTHMGTCAFTYEHAEPRQSTPQSQKTPCKVPRRVARFNMLVGARKHRGQATVVECRCDMCCDSVQAALQREHMKRTPPSPSSLTPA